MTRPEPSVSPYRVVFMGSDAVLARQTLESLIDCDIRPVTVVADQDSSAVMPFPLPVRVAGAPERLQDLAARHRLPVVHIPDSGQCSLADTLHRLEPDIVLVTCFARRLTGTARRAARMATLNLHPSLLPAYRGPHPLFWQRRAGLREVGITLHGIDEGLDSGTIWRQAACTLPDGVDFPGANALLGRLGAELFAAAVAGYRAGRLNPRPQDASRATYQSAPQAQDFRLSTDWSARHAFNFVRLAAYWGVPFPVVVGDRPLLITEALEFRPSAVLGRPVRVDGETVAVQFSPGVLYARARGA